MPTAKPGPSPSRHANNFDFLRLVAALAVIFSHSWLIAYGTQRDEPLVWATHNQCPLGLVSVFIFFVISGYLVTESYCRNPNPGGFVLRRAARIYPGLLVNGLVTAFLLGPIVTSLPLSTYFADPGLRDFLMEIATMWPGPLALPGAMFVDNTVGLLINGALWTLCFEVMMYATVLILGIMRMLNLWTALVLLVVGIVAIWWDERWSLAWLDYLRGWLWMLSHFAAGMVMYFLRGRIVFRWYYAVLAVALLVLTSQLGEFITFFALSSGYLTIYAATRYWPRLDYARHVGDLSYGIYIYGWPCEELVMWLSGGRAQWWEVTLGSLAMVLPLSWLSWHGVEKWTLRWARGRLRATTAVPTVPESVARG
ncbi:MAG TPA: acyltransferase [Stellaceae bacterium]|jgi:peptidoglycan/LPS O-acetylase OafA/YrhL|nr:acyltransferase [Stellaceae bacterium]